MSNAEKVKDAVRIEAYLASRFPSLKRSGHLLKMCCPMHPEKTPSFVVNVENQSWRCYGACLSGGDVIAFVMQHDHLSFGDALQVLADYARIELDALSPKMKEAQDKEARLLSLLDTAAALCSESLYDPLGTWSLNYLRDERGLTDETLKTFRIGYAVPLHVPKVLFEMGYSKDDMKQAGILGQRDNGEYFDRFKGRVMYPIMDHKGRVRGFGARAMGDDHPKYINSPQSEIFDKSSLIYGMSSRVKNGQGEAQTVIVLEGYHDVLKTRQNGFLNTVAQMGTALTDKQLTLLSQQGIKTVILCLDNDSAGQSAMQKLAQTHVTSGLLSRLGIELKLMTLTGGKDADEAVSKTPDIWELAVKDSRPVVEALIDLTVKALPQNAALTHRQDAARALLPILTVDGDVWATRDNTRILATALKIDEQVLIEWTSRAAFNVMPKNGHVKPVDQKPTDDHWLIFYIVRYEADEYINKADAVLCQAGMELRPPEPWMLPCFMGLNSNDFTHPECRRLFDILKDARARNEPMGDVLELETIETDLYETYERCINADQWELAIGCKSEISLRMFLDTTLTVRMASIDRMSAPLRDTDTALWANYQSAWVMLDEMRMSL